MNVLAAAFLLALAGTGAPELPRCTEADVSLITRLDSATDIAGGAFAFKTVARVPAFGDVPDIPAGTRGFGVIAFADHAHGSGQPGRIVVEPRFLVLPDGTHVQVIDDPQFADNFLAGDTGNVNGAFQYVPGIGLAVAGYNAFHHGKEIAIERGTQFRVVVGDALASGECYVPPPSAPNVH